MLFVQDLTGGAGAPAFTGQIALWLWLTVLFATFSESVAEGRGKAQAEGLKRGRSDLIAKKLLSFLPSNNTDGVPEWPSFDDIERTDDSLNTLVPDNPNKPYDIKELILKVVDEGDFFEIAETFAKNIVTGFGRIAGRTVGFVANQPMVLAGVLDSDASRKAARFVRFCDAFNIPIVTFVDVPGFLPGTSQEFEGIIRHGAKLLYAYAEATIPKITIVTRKAYGGGYIVMSSKHLRGDINLAYPTAEIAVMGPEGAINIVFREALQQAQDSSKARDQMTQEYRNTFANPFKAAEFGYIDSVIYPEDTRPTLIRSLEMLKNKQDYNPPKKHGNIPL